MTLKLEILEFISHSIMEQANIGGPSFSHISYDNDNTSGEVFFIYDGVEFVISSDSIKEVE